jgi:YidC/Oxa1 family membrane protein insertase
MKKLLVLLFSILISFNSYGGWFGFTSIEDTTCNDLQKEAKGSELKNQFGGEFKVLKVSNSREISRTKDKLVCIGDLKLDNGDSNSELRMELTYEDGEFWIQFTQEINFEDIFSTSFEDIFPTSVNLQDTIICSEITDKDKRLSCYDSLSDGLNSSSSITDNPKVIDVPDDSNIKRSYTTVITDLLTVEISHKGGTIINAYLNDYPNALNSEEKFQLLNNTPGSIFHVQSGLIPADQMPTHQSEFTSERQEYFLQGDMGLNVPLIWIGDNGVQVTKNYHFKPNSYIIYIDYIIRNNGNKDQILSNYSQFIFESTDTLKGGVIMTDKGNGTASADRIHFDEFDTTPKTTSIGGFAAIIYKDFIAAWVPIQNQKITYSTKKSKSRNQYLLTIVNPSQKVLAGTSVIIPKNDLFIGPKELFNEAYK